MNSCGHAYMNEALMSERFCKELWNKWSEVCLVSSHRQPHRQPNANPSRAPNQQHLRVVLEQGVSKRGIYCGLCNASVNAVEH